MNVKPRIKTSGHYCSVPTEKVPLNLGTSSFSKLLFIFCTGVSILIKPNLFTVAVMEIEIASEGEAC